MKAALIPYPGAISVAGCDEAGRGCLAGPVYAAAVMFPPGYTHPNINDSKKLKPALRLSLAQEIRNDALAWGIGIVSADEIDQMNILRASIMAMHRALDQMRLQPEKILVDGNRFIPYRDIPYECYVKGDGRYLAIAAASILAKTSRDACMAALHKHYPVYGWDRNKGYPVPVHLSAIEAFGLCEHHRKTFRSVRQPTLPFIDL